MPILTERNIQLDVAATTKSEAMEHLAALAVENGYATDSRGVLDGLEAREAQLSTFLMDGIAIPHAKHAAITSAAVLVIRLAEEVDWSGHDARVLICMLVPEAEAGTTHLTLLAQVSRAIIDDDVRATLTTGDAPTIHRVLSDRME